MAQKRNTAFVLLTLLLSIFFPVHTEEKIDEQSIAIEETNSQTATEDAFSSPEDDILPTPIHETARPEDKNKPAAPIHPAHQYHIFEGGVSAIADSQIDHAFFVAGNDGFITRYAHDDLTSETYQIADMPIKFIAVHPKKNYIAIYATDEFSVHSVSLWDWTQKKELYNKRFNNAVLSLAWSAKGSYLFIGTASLEGIAVVDIRGKQKHIYPSPPGIVLLAATGPSEKNIVTYGETGRLVYADIAKAAIITQYTTEDRLQTPELIKNYTNIVGCKDDTVFVIKATSGEVLKQYPARSAILAGRLKDTEPVWIERGDDINTWQLCHGEKKAAPFTLPNHIKITAARHGAAGIVIGTNDGKVYRLNQSDPSHTELEALAPKNHTKIYDICTKDSSIYILTEKALYVMDEKDQIPQFYAETPKANNCTPYQNGFLLWTHTKTAPLYYIEKDAEPLILYQSKEILNSVSVYNDTIAIAHTFSGLRLIDGKNKHKQFVYHAAGIQEALQINDNFVLISKSATDSTRCPLFLINIHTGETIPLKIEGDLAFCLTAHPNKKNNIACFRLRSDGNHATELITIEIDTETIAATTSQTLLSYNDEVLHAFIHKTEQSIITNLGSRTLLAHDISRKKRYTFKRDYALPQKAISTSTYILSLNYDSSCSWFNKKNMKLIKTNRVNFTE